MDQRKLKDKIDQEFGELSDRIFLILRSKMFHNFKNSVEFRFYMEIVEKFINLDPAGCKEILFAIFDLNNDRFLCETDMFNLVKLIKTFELQKIFMDDVQKVIKKFEFIRKKRGL